MELTSINGFGPGSDSSLAGGHVGCRTAKVVALLQKSGAQLFLYDRPVSGDALQIAAIMLIGRTIDNDNVFLHTNVRKKLRKD